MGYADGAIRKYLDDAAARLPAPGGGSVAALIGALGASMSAMVASFTIGKKKFADVQDDVRRLLEKAEAERRNLTELIDADVQAYGKVSAAYGMPKDTEEEKQARSKAIGEACREALAVPLKAARSCAEVASVCEELIDVGNRNLITDVGVSALAAEAALRAAVLNVEINLGPVGDEDFACRTRTELDSLVGRVSCITDEVMVKVQNAIG